MAIQDYLVDILAMIWFVFVVRGYDLVLRLPHIRERSINTAVQIKREMWMREMANREVRIFDAQLIGWLSNANVFFASTSALTIGGLAALLGSGETARQIVASLPYAAATPPVLWELKVLFLMAVMVYAFFKFAWAFRLSHYVLIMVGATPPYDSPDAAKREAHALATARLLGIVGEHANHGLRAFYYAIAGLAWFYHPLAFIAVAAGVLVMTIRRDHFSRARAVISGDGPLPPLRV
ncbi:MAG: DUF599 domain-containing protein [Hyphomicrobiaceae bacterium]|nr:DUF599 domain-containing protein [Hyphomicrobiaceae bacterium]